MPEGHFQEKYLVAGCKPWNRRVFDEIISHYSGKWHYITDRDQLNRNFLRQLGPRQIFFLHWSWIVPPEIVDAYECICLHMTDVPFGRGGSPLQNLIVRGIRSTRITALRMVSKLDAGPVYLKEDLSLEGGNAEEIYIRACYMAAQMIGRIVKESPQPVAQTGDIVEFKRRKQADSEMRQLKSLLEVFDFIRMLDADGYPGAFFIHDGFRYEFSRAGLYDGRVRADVTITRGEEPAQ